MMDTRAHVQPRAAHVLDLGAGRDRVRRGLVARASGRSLPAILAIASQEHNAEARSCSCCLLPGPRGSVSPRRARDRRGASGCSTASSASCRRSSSPPARFSSSSAWCSSTMHSSTSQDGSISLSRNRTSNSSTTLVVALRRDRRALARPVHQTLGDRVVSARREPRSSSPHFLKWTYERTSTARSACSAATPSLLIGMAIVVLVLFWFSFRDAAANVAAGARRLRHDRRRRDRQHRRPRCTTATSSTSSTSTASGRTSSTSAIRASPSASGCSCISSLATRRHPEEAGKRADVIVARLTGRVALARRGRDQTRRRARQRRAGEARAARSKPATCSSTTSRAREPLGRAPEDDRRSPIVYEDDDLLVVDKPAGMVTHPAHGATSGTLVNALLAHVGTLPGDALRPGLVHRLDRDTSGLLVVAKTRRGALGARHRDESAPRSRASIWAWSAACPSTREERSKARSGAIRTTA